MQAAEAWKACMPRTHTMEALFRSLVATMFLQGMLHNGSIVDCGAHHGTESCYYAQLQPNRTVRLLHGRSPSQTHNESQGLAEHPTASRYTLLSRCRTTGKSLLRCTATGGTLLC